MVAVGVHAIEILGSVTLVNPIRTELPLQTNLSGSVSFVNPSTYTFLITVSEKLHDVESITIKRTVY